MPNLWERFREGGWPNWMIVLLGLLGFLMGTAAIAAPLVSKKRLAALIPGLAAASLVCLILAVGMGGMLFDLRRVDDAIAGASVRPALRERIYRQGLDESKSCVEFAVGFALFPALGALIALLLAAARRPDPVAPPPGGPYANTLPAAPSSNAAPFVGLGLMPIFFVGALALHAKKAPGRELDRSSYLVVDALDQLDDGRSEEGCRAIAELERLDASEPARALPELRELVKRCAKIDLEEAEAVLGPGRDHPRGSVRTVAEIQRRLDAWKRTTLPLDPVTKASIETTRARLSAPTPR